ncbi:hypothetical protein CYMTET_50818, partial [Cymbomonas tetramitiformis]
MGRLHEASAQGAAMKVKKLLAGGSSVDLRNEKGETALHTAAEHGKPGVIQLLLTGGADKNAASRTQKTSLHLSAERGHEEVLRLLLEASVEIHAVDVLGRTSLHGAVFHNQLAAVQLLLRAGLEVDGADSRLLTALHLAAEAGNDDMARLLLEAGAATEARDREGRTPLHLAASHGRQRVLQALLDEHSEKDAVDAHLCTPLHLAAAAGHTGAVLSLLSAKASRDMVDCKERTPADVAQAAGHRAVAEILLVASSAPPTPMGLRTPVLALEGGAGVNAGQTAKTEVPSETPFRTPRDAVYAGHGVKGPLDSDPPSPLTANKVARLVIRELRANERMALQPTQPMQPTSAAEIASAKATGWPGLAKDVTAAVMLPEARWEERENVPRPAEGSQPPPLPQQPAAKADGGGSGLDASSSEDSMISGDADAVARPACRKLFQAKAQAPPQDVLVGAATCPDAAVLDKARAAERVKADRALAEALVQARREAQDEMRAKMELRMEAMREDMRVAHAAELQAARSTTPNAKHIAREVEAAV